MTPPPNDPSRSRLIERLRRLRRRRLALEGAAALLTALAVTVVAGGLATALEAALYLGPTARLSVLCVAAAAAVVAGGVRLRRWRDGLSLRAMALAVETSAPQLAQRLMAALELGGDTGRSRLYSAQLLGAATAQAAAILDQLRDHRLVPSRELRRASAGFGLTASALVVGLWASGSAGMDALHRCLHPMSTFQRPQRTLVRVEPGDLTAVRGDDVEVSIHLGGETPSTLRVQRRAAGADIWTEEEVILESGRVEPGRLESGRPDTLRHLFGDVRAGFEYIVRAGDGHAGPYQVSVIDPPAVTRLRLQYEYPEYSGLEPRVDEEGGDIRALAGTRVDFEVHASKALAAADLVLGDSLRLPARVVDDRAHVSWRLPAADSTAERLGYHLSLIDRGGVANRAPIRYAVQVLHDGAPQVDITVPGGDDDLPESQQAVLQVEATDDFGLSRVRLVYRVNDGGEQDVPLLSDGQTQETITYAWDLSPHELLPEDRVHYRAEAFDNDAVGGPKKAVSPEYVLRFPSLYELFDEATEEHEERLESLQELAQEEAGAREYVEQLRREVLRTEELTWDQKQELEAALAAEEKRARAVEELAQEMADSVDKMEQGGLSSEDLLSKLDEIRELMSSVASPELLEALQALQEAVVQPDAEQLAEALRQFAEDQEAFQQRLDRTLDLLRQVHAEQRMMAAVAQAEDLESRQERINESVNRDESGPRLGDQEARLAGDTDRLQQELSDLGEALEDLSEQTAEALTSQSQRMGQSDLSGRMRQMQQDLAAHRNERAERLGAGLQEDLGHLAEDLRRLQGEFFGSQRQEMTGQLRDAMAGLVELSQRQEGLADVTARQRGRSVADQAAEQQALARGVELVIEQVAAVGSRTMALDHGLAATLGTALRRMDGAAARLGQLDRGRANRLQEEAVGYLNEAVLGLRQSIDNLAQATTPSSFAEAMQKMMGLSEQQAALNQATQQALQQGSQPGSSGRGRDGDERMARLAAEQRRIYRALAEVEKSLRGQRSLQERVGEIQREMEGVLARMQRRQVDPRVTQGQQRILQRMLDASRSIHARGFEKRRRSETAEQRGYAGPDWMPVDLGQRPDALREAMRRALAAGYPAEYRELIRRYYEAVYQDLHDGQGALP